MDAWSFSAAISVNIPFPYGYNYLDTPRSGILPSIDWCQPRLSPVHTRTSWMDACALVTLDDTITRSTLAVVFDLFSETGLWFLRRRKTSSAGQERRMV